MNLNKNSGDIMRAQEQHLDASWEESFLSLTVPLFNPSVGAHRAIDAMEILTNFSALALHFLTTMEVDVALVAVFGLVGIGKAWIEGSGLELDFLFNLLRGHDDAGLILARK